MKKSCFIILVFLFSMALKSAFADDEPQLKKVWKIEQIYFDSITGTLDTILVKFRMIPAGNSVFYLHDGRLPRIMYWYYNVSESKIMVFENSNFNGSAAFLEYQVQYLDDQNLVLLLDVSNKNIGVNRIEYRLVPDSDFFNQ